MRPTKQSLASKIVEYYPGETSLASVSEKRKENSLFALFFGNLPDCEPSQKKGVTISRRFLALLALGLVLGFIAGYCVGKFVKFLMSIP